MRCQACGRDVRQLDPYGGRLVCTPCRVGSRDPFEVMLGEAEELSRRHHTGYSILRFDRDGLATAGPDEVTLGLCIGALADPQPFHLDRWSDTATAQRPMVGKVERQTLLRLMRASVRDLWRLRDQHRVGCSRCHLEVDESQLGGRHFASTYCQTCWEAYKRENGGSCSICRQPRFECTC